MRSKAVKQSKASVAKKKQASYGGSPSLAQQGLLRSPKAMKQKSKGRTLFAYKIFIII
jgi:hypothetical protein